MEGMDWDKGPIELLSIVASGRDELKAMREVSRSWKAGFESSVFKIKLGGRSPLLPRGPAFHARFPLACSVDLSASLWARQHPISESLERLIGSRITCLKVWKLTDLDAKQLRGFPLTRLSWWYGGVTDTGLECLRGMQLVELDLHHDSHITSAGVAHLRGMPLRRLSLFFGLDGWKGDPEALAPLAAMPLTDFDLFCPGFRDAGLAPLRGLPLTRLILGGSKEITDAGVAYLRGAPLEDLDLGGCRGLTPQGLAHLRGMPIRRLSLQSWGRHGQENFVSEGNLAALPLTELDLFSSSVTDAGLLLLRGRPLTHLNVGDCAQLTAAGLAALEGMPLKSLILALWNYPLDEAMVHLRGLPLTHVDVECCGGLTTAGMEHLRGMPLRTLMLGCNGQLTDDGLAALEGAPLTRLGLDSLQITGSGLGALHGAPLTDLDLSECHRLQGLGLLRGLPITKLGLGRCELGSSAMFKSLHGLPIAELRLYSNPWVTDACLECLAALPLTSLDLSSCMGVTDLGLVHLRRLSLLTSLDLSDITTLTNAGVNSLIDTLPLLASCLS